MKLFNRILDAFKLESTREMESEPLGSGSIRAIKVYWSTHTCNSGFINYRKPSFSEMEEYAKADILSCFEKARNNSSLSDFHLGQMGVTNWNQFFKRLFNAGYIRETNNKETLDSYTLKELKIIADSIGVKKSGRKAELIQRICDSLSSNDLSGILKGEKLFILSEKGKEYLKTQDDYPLLRAHAKYDITLAEFNDKRIIGGKRRNFYDTMFQVLRDKKAYYELEKNFTMVEITSLRIYEIMMEEYERTEHNVPLDVALNHYIESLYLRLCFSMEVKNLIDGIDVYDSMVCAPHISEKIHKLSDYKDLINYKMVFFNKPPAFLTQEEFIRFIEEIFEEPIFDYEKWTELLKKRFWKLKRML